MQHKIKIVFPLLMIAFAVRAQISDNLMFDLDTITIEFHDSDSIEFENYFENQQIIDSISSCYGNWHERAMAIEDYLLRKYSLDIAREGNVRIETLKNGKKVKLIPNDSIDEAGYTFEKIILNGKFHLYRVQWFEGNNYFLFNTTTGEKTYMIGRVYPNPTNSILISINDDIEAGYSENGFQLFFLNNKLELVELWRYDSNWGPANIKWISNNSFIVKGYTYDFNEDYDDDFKYIEFYKKVNINMH